ncbi:putative receptor protein kinase TMK1-like, partial [Trifolium medium]|nr:putative receptor protein kinase TMK1-like [Trifolium medium]
MIAAVDIINAESDEANYMSDLFKALNPTPMGWSNKTHYCEWKGVSCDSTRSVTSIKLPSSSLTGTLPPNINTLTNLTHVDLHNNSLNGPLPEFNRLFLLQTVSLGHNNFTSVPDDCFQYLSDLKTLNLSNNLNLYPWVFPLSNLASSSKSLDSLDLEATNMIGSLDPDTFDWFPNLQTFIISHNKIDGLLPESLGKSSVRYLRLNSQRGHMFWGTIEVISTMSNLSQAWLHENSFAGLIPNLSNCTNLFDLQLHSNILSGFVPPSLLALSSLKIISLDNNMLYGPIPVFHKGVKATWETNNFCQSDVGLCDPQLMVLLQILEPLGSSYILSIQGSDACTGAVWTNKILTDRILIRCERGKIVSFGIWNFSLTGSRSTISPAFSNLTSLVNLTLTGVNLTGSIPNSIATLPQLQLLDVSNNNLSGQIPKFPSKVKLITRGNAFLDLNISQQLGGGQNASTTHHGGSSKTTLRAVLIA